VDVADLSRPVVIVHLGGAFAGMRFTNVEFA
jgi:hypothetical protein